MNKILFLKYFRVTDQPKLNLQVNASLLLRSLRNGLFTLLFFMPFISFGQINPDLIGDRYGIIAHGQFRHD